MFGSIKSNGFVLSLDKCNIFIPGAKNDKTSWELFCITQLVGILDCDWPVAFYVI